MSRVRSILEALPGRYIPDSGQDTVTYYLSIGDERWTLSLDSENCQIAEGRTVERADCVLKCTPDLFVRMVLHGQMPGALDIARGRIRTNSPMMLRSLQERFRTE